MEAKTRRWLRLGATGLLLLLVGIVVVLAIEYNTSESSAAAVSLIRDPIGDFTRQHGAAKGVVLVGSSAKTLTVGNVSHGCARNLHLVLTADETVWVDVYFRKSPNEGKWVIHEATTGFRAKPRRLCSLA